jgi:hypothetical protein
MRAALFYLRQEVWRIVPWSRRSSWRILHLAGIMACPVSVEERLRGWCQGRPFGHCPYICLRVRLMGGHRAHNSWRGGVLSPRLHTVLERPRWPHWTDGVVLVRARRSRSSSLRGLRRPF